MNVTEKTLGPFPIDLSTGQAVGQTGNPSIVVSLADGAPPVAASIETDGDQITVTIHRCSNSASVEQELGEAMATGGELRSMVTRLEGEEVPYGAQYRKVFWVEPPGSAEFATAATGEPAANVQITGIADEDRVREIVRSEFGRLLAACDAS